MIHHTALTFFPMGTLEAELLVLRPQIWASRHIQHLTSDIPKSET